MEWYLLMFLIALIPPQDIKNRCMSFIFLLVYIATPYLYEHYKLPYDKVILVATMEWLLLSYIALVIYGTYKSLRFITFSIGVVGSLFFLLIQDLSYNYTYYYTIFNRVLLEAYLLFSFKNKYWLVSGGCIWLITHYLLNQ